MNIEDLARMGWTYSEKSDRYTVLYNRVLLTCRCDVTSLGAVYSFSINSQAVEDIAPEKLYKAIHARAYQKIVEHLEDMEKEPEPDIDDRLNLLEAKVDRLINLPNVPNAPKRKRYIY